MEKKSWINKLDELDGGRPAPPPPPKNGLDLNFGGPRENMVIYGLAGAAGLLLILVVVLFFRTGKDPATGQFQEVQSSLEAMENRLARYETREEERQRSFSLLMESEQNIKSRLDSQRETLDDLRQKLAALERQGQRTVQAPPRQEQPRAEVRPEAAAGDQIIHEVQRGENLFRIGLQYNVSVDRIRQLNNLSPDDAIHPGQKLIVGTRNN